MNQEINKQAIELVNKFYQPLGHLKCGVNNTIMWEHAKQCALIACDLLIDSTLHGIDLDLYEGSYNGNCKEHWIEIKQAIENL